MGVTRNSSELLLKIENLTRNFPVGTPSPGKSKNVLAVDNLSLEIYQGETLGLVGESGCGKSTLALTIAGFLNPSQGKIYFEGKDLSSRKVRKSCRTEIQMVFQDSYSSLNPRKNIYSILAEPLRINRLATKKDVAEKVYKLLESVGLPRHYTGKYPGELSGGERQRVNIARAISLKPKLIVCDEPVSALDLSVQAQVLNLLADLQKEYNLTYLFIAHGLGNVQYISDRIAVMYLGGIVEIGTSEEIFTHALHPYTEAFLNASPVPDPKYRREIHNILCEEAADALKTVSGCKFYGRCQYASGHCKENVPKLRFVQEGNTSHACACFLYEKFLY